MINIQDILPHRYPFIMVDKINFIEDDCICTSKMCSYNEQFYQGHFPNKPIMPGVLIIEAMAQSCGIYISQQKDVKITNQSFALASINNAKFTNIVTVGHVLDMVCNKIYNKMNIWKFKCTAYVYNKYTARAELTLAPFK